MVDLPRLRVTDPERVRPAFLRITLLGAAGSVALALPFAAVAGLPSRCSTDRRTAAPRP